MKYSELVDSGATPSEIQTFLVDSELVPVTIRIPRTLRDSAKEAAALSGLTFTSLVKMCLIEKLSEGNSGER
jgi:predicted DNA binding CopG/RHH family protein